MNWIPGGVDIDPLWAIMSTMVNGGVCGGALRLVSRTRAMQIADNYEQIGGEQWLRGKRQP